MTEVDKQLGRSAGGVRHGDDTKRQENCPALEDLTFRLGEGQMQIRAKCSGKQYNNASN